MVKDYLIRKREAFNEYVRHYGNKVRDGLGDTLTTDATIVAPATLFFGTWLGINSYTALEQQATGLVERAYSPELAERIVAHTTIAMQGLNSNIAGLLFGAGAALLLGGLVVKLDELLLREDVV